MTNYFALLNLPETFDLSLKDLEEHFQEQAERFHPDRFANRSAFEKKQYTRLFATLNDAYQKLKDPISRAEYFLTLNGVDYDPETVITRDVAWLEKQLEYREKIDETSDLKLLINLHQETEAKLTAVFAAINTAINNKDWPQVIASIGEAKFWQNLNHSIAAKEAALNQ